MDENNVNEDKLFDAELFISSSLRIGVFLAAVVVALGLLTYFFSGTTGYPAGVFPTSVADVYSGLQQLKPAAVISLGLLLLIATPVFRVGASVIIFIIEKDHLYTVITLLVFVILLFSLIFGKAL